MTLIALFARTAGVMVMALATAGCPASLSSVENEANSVRATTKGDYQAIYACVEANIEKRILDKEMACEPRVRDLPAHQRARLWCELPMFLGPSHYLLKHDIYQEGEEVVVIAHFGPTLFHEKSERRIREFWSGCL